MPDFCQPGKEGALPRGVPEWRDGLGGLMTRGLIYTARGASSFLRCDQKYRITAGFKQKVAKTSSFTGYVDIYQRVTRLAASRAAEICCAHGEPLHARIAGHSWSCIPGGDWNFPMAALVTELSCRRGACNQGEPAPTPGALVVPGGTSREEFSRVASHPSEEFNSEYDVGDPAGTVAEPFSFSYGEHVEACVGINYAPFVERAEHRARLHHGELVVSGAAKLSFAVLRRDWWAVPDNLVVVVVYFRA